MCYFHSPVSTGQSWLLAPSCYFGSDRCMFTGPLGWFRLLTTWWEFLRPCLFPRGFSVPCMIESDWHLDIRTGGRHLSSLVACQVWNFSLCSAADAMLKVVVFGWIVSLVAPGLFKCQTPEGQTYFVMPAENALNLSAKFPIKLSEKRAPSNILKKWRTEVWKGDIKRETLEMRCTDVQK